MFSEHNVVISPLERNLQYTQTKRNMDDKWSNVADAFRVRTTDNLSGKHILIIDDVLTTGSTAEAAYTALTKVCKDCKISFATLGYVE